MQRLVLASLGLLGTLALSCQVLTGPVPAPPGADELAGLPPVATPPPSRHSLADTIAGIEGGSVALDERQVEIRRVMTYLDERHTGLSSREIRQVARTIVDEAAAQDVEVGLVLAVIQVESAGYHRAVSPVGALGLMQLMPATGEELARKRGIPWYGPATLFDPVVNVKLGIAYLRALSDRYDHVPTALAAYNWGPGRIDGRIRRKARVPEVYVKQVMRIYDEVAAAAERADASS
jgi:soluble lytic murein transglycosylase-like protein